MLSSASQSPTPSQCNFAQQCKYFNIFLARYALCGSVCCCSDACLRLKFRGAVSNTFRFPRLLRLHSRRRVECSACRRPCHGFSSAALKPRKSKSSEAPQRSAVACNKHALCRRRVPIICNKQLCNAIICNKQRQSSAIGQSVPRAAPPGARGPVHSRPAGDGRGPRGPYRLMGYSVAGFAHSDHARRVRR